MSNPQATILQQFLNAGHQFVSGSAIAHTLGCSRVNVHKHLEALRREGFRFEAVPRRGYRLLAGPDAFHPEFFRALLLNGPLPFYQHFHYKNTTGSTNSDAERAMAENATDPVLVVAGAQSAGRGRRGRAWHSPPGRNLYLSVGLRPELPPARLQAITLFLGMAVCLYLRSEYNLPVMVKWPNDLLLHDRKLAGMLTEARVNAEHTRELVFGIGLNVNATAGDFPPDLRHTATSIAATTGRQVPTSRLAYGLARVLAKAFADYLRGPEAPTDWMQQWQSADALLGRSVKAGEHTGIAEGINSAGSLCLRRADGSRLLLHSGEVSVRPTT